MRNEMKHLQPLQTFAHSEFVSRGDPAEAAAARRVHMNSLKQFTSFNEGVWGRLDGEVGSHLHGSFRYASTQVSPLSLENKTTTSDQSEFN